MRTSYEKPLLTEDYLIRMINLVLAAIARVVGLRTVGQYQAAHEEINYTLAQIFGLSAPVVRVLDDNVLLGYLTHQGVLDTDRLYVIADLMKEEGDLFSLGGQPAAGYWSYLRALNFFLEVALHGGAPGFPDPGEKISALVRVLEGFSLPPRTLFALFSYYEQVAAYAQARETLARLVRSAERPGDLVAERQAFYRRLLARTDDELAAGGLSRPVVEADLDMSLALEGEAVSAPTSPHRPGAKPEKSNRHGH